MELPKKIGNNGAASNCSLDTTTTEESEPKRNIPAMLFIRNYWRSLVLVLAPIVLLPLPLIVQTVEARCGYVLLVMASYWVSEAVHLAATALIPVFAFPLLGIMSTNDVCLTYMKDTNMLFLGGLAMAAAIEDSSLHERIALFILIKIGSSMGRLLLGFMMTQMFLSMWISNTAATAMMVPIVDAVLSKIGQVDESELKTPRNSVTEDDLEMSPSEDETINRMKQTGECSQCGAPAVPPETLEELLEKEVVCHKLRDVVYLGLAYAANIGGTGSLTGTNPNLVLVGFLQLWYPDKETGINYATWLLFNVPGMLLCTTVGYIWLRLVLMYYSKNKHQPDKASEEAICRLLNDRYKSLGKITFHEKMVSSLFALAVLLWLFRKPEIIGGWGPYMESIVGQKITAATPAILIVFLMFAAPTVPFWNKGDGSYSPSPGCLKWSVFHHKVPWGVIVLIGGGFAIAEGGKQSGLSAWLGLQFQSFANLPKEAALILVCVLTAMLTEVMSNTAASSLLLPVLNNMSLAMKVNPIYFLLPVTLCCSYAFMLPVATPPNAIVFEAAQSMPISRMMCAGLTMNIVCVLITFFTTNTLGTYMFAFDTFPEWANSSVIS